MKKMIIAWVLIATSLLGTLYFIGINFNKEYREYRDLEGDMIESASIYLTLNQIKLNVNEKVTLTSDDLLKSKVLSTMDIKNDTCIGYVIVSRSNEYDYNSYIKCKNYTTTDYEKYS